LNVDLEAGAGRVMQGDRAGLGFSGTVKGLYALTGVLYVNMGIGMTSMQSESRNDTLPFGGKHTASIITLPIGIGFTIGDDHAQIFNSINIFPMYYIDHPLVKKESNLTYGFGLDLGYYILIKKRLHLGMMGKLQLFQSFDREERPDFPRFGFVGGGILLRYD